MIEIQQNLLQNKRYKFNYTLSNSIFGDLITSEAQKCNFIILNQIHYILIFKFVLKLRFFDSNSDWPFKLCSNINCQTVDHRNKEKNFHFKNGGMWLLNWLFYFSVFIYIGRVSFLILFLFLARLKTVISF